MVLLYRGRSSSLTKCTALGGMHMEQWGKGTHLASQVSRINPDDQWGDDDTARWPSHPLLFLLRVRSVLQVELLSLWITSVLLDSLKMFLFNSGVLQFHITSCRFAFVFPAPIQCNSPNTRICPSVLKRLSATIFLNLGSFQFYSVLLDSIRHGTFSFYPACLRISCMFSVSLSLSATF